MAKSVRCSRRASAALAMLHKLLEEMTLWRGRASVLARDCRQWCLRSCACRSCHRQGTEKHSGTAEEVYEIKIQIIGEATD